jgi:YD repeat-containing protein
VNRIFVFGLACAASCRPDVVAPNGGRHPEPHATSRDLPGPCVAAGKGTSDGGHEYRYDEGRLIAITRERATLEAWRYDDHGRLLEHSTRELPNADAREYVVRGAEDREDPCANSDDPMCEVNQPERAVSVELLDLEGQKYVPPYAISSESHLPGCRGFGMNGAIERWRYDAGDHVARYLGPQIGDEPYYCLPGTQESFERAQGKLRIDVGEWRNIPHLVRVDAPAEAWRVRANNPDEMEAFAQRDWARAIDRPPAWDLALSYDYVVDAHERLLVLRDDAGDRQLRWTDDGLPLDAACGERRWTYERDERGRVVVERTGDWEWHYGWEGDALRRAELRAPKRQSAAVVLIELDALEKPIHAIAHDAEGRVRDELRFDYACFDDHAKKRARPLAIYEVLYSWSPSHRRPWPRPQALFTRLGYDASRPLAAPGVWGTGRGPHTDLQFSGRFGCQGP